MQCLWRHLTSPSFFLECPIVRLKRRYEYISNQNVKWSTYMKEMNGHILHKQKIIIQIAFKRCHFIDVEALLKILLILSKRYASTWQCRQEGLIEIRRTTFLSSMKIWWKFTRNANKMTKCSYFILSEWSPCKHKQHVGSLMMENTFKIQGDFQIRIEVNLCNIHLIWKSNIK